ncbi:MAG: hypothetical protein JSV82_05500 [Planctomycetota bacterium]|nr:MAG: hypothetical protein JSV82_05500 [Planctomycetota bacterium]
MWRCSVTKKLQIVRGCLEDYKKLARYHYRDSHPGMFTKIFAIRPAKALGARLGTKTIGVIVYTLPTAGVELRNIATDNLFAGLDRSTQLALIDKNIRRISRVIIEPRFRALGLATRLVRETMPEMGVPIIEGITVMGLVNPFLEKAGMKAYRGTMPVRCLQVLEALSLVGIEKEDLIDAEKVQGKLDELECSRGEFIEVEIKGFLSSYGKRRYMEPGLERTRFLLSKLTSRPVYYIWFNPKLQLLTT